jgi:hypothetical protein
MYDGCKVEEAKWYRRVRAEKDCLIQRESIDNLSPSVVQGINPTESRHLKEVPLYVTGKD